MKNFKIFAMACLVLGFMACNKNNGNDPENPGTDPGSNPDVSVKITLAASQYSVKVGATVQIEAVVTPAGTDVTYTSLDPTIASVDANGLVTGVKAGNTIVTLKAGNVSENCIISVIEDGGIVPGEKPTVKGKRIWTIIMDGTTAESATVAPKIVYSFAPNGTTRNLWFWEGTYQGNTATGSNFFQTEANGGFLSAVVSDGVTWSGMGYSISDGDTESMDAVNALIAEIKANPAKFHFHMAIKSSQQGSSHAFSLFGLGGGNTTGLKWCVGEYYSGESNGTYQINYDGSWNVIDFGFDKYVAPLDTYVATPGKGMNILVAQSTGVAGNILNLDAAYIYEVE